MAYRLKLKEHLRDGVRRICVEQLDKALAEPHIGAARMEWVHQTRKSTKRLRSLLRLVQSGLTPDVRRKANAELRRIARDLSGMRDRDVMRQTLDKLSSELKDKELAAPFAWLAEKLEPAPAEVATTTQPMTDAISDAVADLTRARDDLGSIDIDGDLVDIVAQGLAKCQRAGRKALSNLEADPSDENLHELRKAVQTYQRQQSLIVAVCPEAQAIRIESARVLAQVLGEAQDLAVLAAFARRHRDDANDFAASIIDECRVRQTHICERAIPQAARLFATPHEATAAEFEHSWKAAVRLSKVRSPA